MTRISIGWRVALFAKAALLLAIGLGLIAIAFFAVRDGAWPVKVVGGVAFGWLGAFVCWAGSLGFADAAVGQTRTEENVRVLENRRRGYSMRTPTGRFIEFILWNPWDKLEPYAAYTVTYGRFSGVIVAAPRRTGPSTPMPTR